MSDLTLQHELSVIDCKAVIFAAIQKHPKLSIAEFSTCPLLFQFRTFHPATGERVLVKPDGFLRLVHLHPDDRVEQQFYLEVDRSTESQETLIAKLQCYQDHLKRQRQVLKLRGVASSFREFPPRVLVVCRTINRRENLTDRLIRSKLLIGNSASVITMEELATDSACLWVFFRSHHAF